MAIADLLNIGKLFGGEKITEAEKKNLLKEVLLLTLSRASIADSNIKPIEVSVIQNTLQSVSGEAFTEQQIRVAAHSELYETKALDALLAQVAGTLSEQDRVLIATSLAALIKSDEKVTYQEVEFFNRMVSALKLTSASLVGLIAD